MDIEDAVLSDALVGTTVEAEEIGETIGDNRYEVVRRRYEFWNVVEDLDACSSSSSDEEQVTTTSEIAMDREGDMKVSRRPKCRDFLIIDHTMATTLSDVGLQVAMLTLLYFQLHFCNPFFYFFHIWHGALLLCDYVLFRREEIRDRVVVELGCGAGMTALCAAMAGARIVFATDSDPKTLQLTDRNTSNNESLLPDGGKTIKTRTLDWRRSLSDSLVDWPPSDQGDVSEISIVLAADVIYDPQLNESLFKMIEELRAATESHRLTIVISLEKRYNFTLADLDVACPAYAHFRRWTDARALDGWSIERIDTGRIPICFTYQRNADMELWKISCPDTFS